MAKKVTKFWIGSLKKSALYFLIFVFLMYIGMLSFTGDAPIGILLYLFTLFFVPILCGVLLLNSDFKYTKLTVLLVLSLIFYLELNLLNILLQPIIAELQGLDFPETGIIYAQLTFIFLSVVVGCILGLTLIFLKWLEEKKITKLKSILLFSLFLCVLLTFNVVALDNSIPNVGANFFHKSGITGKGSGICVIDSGFDYTHPSLGNCNENSFLAGTCNRFVAGYDFGENDSNPIAKTSFTNPIIGHGTLVLGGLASIDSKYKGIAPGANMILLKVARDNVTSSNQEIFNNVGRAIQWCLDNHSRFNITSISISMALINKSFYNESNCVDHFNLQKKIQNASSMDIAVFAGSGNCGITNNAIVCVSSISGIDYPACLHNVTAVGSSFLSNIISVHTNRGSALDILAPGSYLKSTRMGGGFTPWYLEPLMSGTSGATPHVSGSVALIKEYDPGMRVKDIERLLVNTGTDVEAIIGTETYPKLNLLNAINVKDWPTENHDFRRTGSTILKGDLTSKSQLKSNINFFLDAATGSEQVVKPSIADIEDDGFMDMAVIVHKTSFNTYSKLLGLTTYHPSYLQGPFAYPKWTSQRVNGGAIYFPPTIANIDDDPEKEIITGTRNGSVYVYDVNYGSITLKWEYHFEERDVPGPETDEVRFNGGSAVTDIDLDGDMEVIVADVYDWNADWLGRFMS